MQQTLAGGRWVQWVVITGATVVAVVSAIALVVLGSPPERAVIHVAAYSLGYLFAGSVAWIRRPDNRVGPVMLAIAVAGSLSFFGRYPDSTVGYAAGLAGTISNILVVWVTLAAPSGRLAPGAGRWLLGGFAAVLLSASFVTSLDVLRVLFALGVVSSLLLAAFVFRRWKTASTASRRSLTPVVVAGVTILLVHAVDLAAGVLLVPVVPGSPIYWADTLSRLLVPFGFLIGLLRLRMARGAVAGLVVDLGMEHGELTPRGALREALADALGDPGVVVLYWSPEARAYIDATGTRVDPHANGTGRAVTYLEHGREPLGAIVHDPALSEDPGLVAAAAAAVRLAVDNERLTAEVQTQLEEVRASRVRIIEAGDAERRRVERDLHDGAQQRIVSMTLALRLVQAKLGAETDPAVRLALDDASTEARAALAELRELARGIHPQILTEAGLGAAVGSLAGRSPVEVSVHIADGDRFSPAVESAAYFVVSEALANVAKYAQAHRAAVRATWLDDVLTVEVSDDGIGGADATAGTGLRGLADRLSAIDGTLDVTSPRGAGTRLRARIPASAPVAT